MSRPTAIALFAAFCLATTPAYAESPTEDNLPASYISAFFRATVDAVIQARSLGEATEAVKPLLARQIQLDEIARFVIARYWQTDNTSATRGFQGQFRDFVAESVALAVRTHPALVLTILGSRPREDGSTLVRSRLGLGSGLSLPLDWNLEPDQPDGSYRIADLVLAGIDARIMLRNMATAVLADRSRNLEDLIALFRHVIARALVKPPSKPPQDAAEP
jgi:ABC-type transporter MlaC component